MSNPIYVTLSSTAVSRVVSLDYQQRPFNTSVAVTGSSSGTFSYGVEFSLDDQQYLAAIGSTRAAVWQPDSLLTAASSNGYSTYTSPVTAIRCTPTALSSAVLILKIVQGGP
jgi:hypothetical protein